MSDVTVVVQDERLPVDHLIFEGIDTTHKADCRLKVAVCDPEECQGPRFTVSELAKFFFGKDAHWIRFRETRGYFYFEGEKVGTRRKAAKRGIGARSYTLADVEKVVHALAGHGAIEASQMTNALVTLKIQGQIWGYLQ